MPIFMTFPNTISSTILRQIPLNTYILHKERHYLFDFDEDKESSLFLICRRASNDMDQFCGKVS